MKLSALVALAFLVSFQPTFLPQQQQNQKGSIEGVVQRAGTNEAIAGAQVSLVRVLQVPTSSVPLNALPGSISVVADAGGRFVLKDLDPGAYRIVVSRDGYARQEYGARPGRQTGTGTILTLAAGVSIKDVVAHLTPAASVNGRVLGPLGEPLTGLEVQVVRPLYDASGRRTFQIAGTAFTDDRGVYRVYWVAPGRYYIAAGPSTRILGAPAPINAASVTTYVRTYYPNTTDPASALSIDVMPAVDVNGIDIAPRQVQTYRVRGRVIDGGSGRLPDQGPVVIAITPRQVEVTPGPNPSTSPGAGGAFEFRDLTPGQYWIRGTLSFGSPPKSLTGIAPIDVVADDLDDVMLILQPGGALTGRIAVQGQGASTPLGFRPSIRLNAVASWASSVAVPVKPDGTFLQENVTGAEYRLTMTALPANFYIKEARLDGMDALARPVQIASSVSATLNITVSPNAGQIDGMVTDNRQQPVSSALVALIPERQRDRTDLYRPATTDSSGHFTIRGIPPGDYKLFAWEDLEEFGYIDSQVMLSAEPGGKLVHILELTKETVNLTAIPARSQ